MRAIDFPPRKPCWFPAKSRIIYIFASINPLPSLNQDQESIFTLRECAHSISPHKPVNNLNTLIVQYVLICPPTRRIHKNVLLKPVLFCFTFCLFQKEHS